MVDDFEHANSHFLPLMNFTAAGSTHVGLVRKKNEDSFFVITRTMFML